MGLLDQFVPGIAADALKNAVSREDDAVLVGPREEQLLKPEGHFLARGRRVHLAIFGVVPAFLQTNPFYWLIGNAGARPVIPTDAVGFLDKKPGERVDVIPPDGH